MEVVLASSNHGKIKEFKELVGVESWVVEKDEETPKYFAELQSDFSSKIGFNVEE